MAEHDWIAKYFVPLATAPGAAGLSDDVSELALGVGRPIVATVDAMVEGVHFRPDDPIASVARKLVRVNVSDILSSGAMPQDALLTLGWSEGRGEDELAEFASALGEELAEWGAALVGGDTVRNPSGLFLSLTMTGVCCGDAPVRRSGASVGDDLWLTGQIGAAYLGFEALMQGDGASEWVSCYREPVIPALGSAEVLVKWASAAMDVSDGLLGDAAKLAAASGVCAMIALESVPFAGKPANLDMKLRLATWGDDYQLLFTARPDDKARIMAELAESGITATVIGQIGSGSGVRATYQNDDVNLPETLGFEHG